MAEGDGEVFGVFKENVMNGAYNLGSGGDTIKVMLGHTYTPLWHTHNKKSEVDAAWTELTGTGYTAGGETLTTQTVTETGTGTAVKGKWDAANLTWTNVDAGTPSYAVMWDDSITTPTAILDGLVAAWEVTTPTNGGNYTLEWAGTGIIRIS